MCFLLLLMTRTQRVVSFFLSSSFSLSEWWLSWSSWFSSRFRFDSVPFRLTGDCPGSVWFSALFFLLSERWLSRSGLIQCLSAVNPSRQRWIRKEDVSASRKGSIMQLEEITAVSTLSEKKIGRPTYLLFGREYTNSHSLTSRIFYSKLDDCTSSSMYRF